MRKREANKELLFSRVSEQPVALAYTPNLSGFTNSTFANSAFSFNAKSGQSGAEVKNE